jgi:hypothetical protein
LLSTNEDLQESFSWLQFGGFLIIIASTLIFNECFRVPGLTRGSAYLKNEYKPLGVSNLTSQIQESSDVTDLSTDSMIISGGLEDSNLPIT